jgi:hypothetical protein
MGAFMLLIKIETIKQAMLAKKKILLPQGLYNFLKKTG